MIEWQLVAAGQAAVLARGVVPAKVMRPCHPSLLGPAQQSVVAGSLSESLLPQYNPFAIISDARTTISASGNPTPLQSFLPA
jgi:hypothetical protein